MRWRAIAKNLGYQKWSRKAYWHEEVGVLAVIMPYWSAEKKIYYLKKMITESQTYNDMSCNLLAPLTNEEWESIFSS